MPGPKPELFDMSEFMPRQVEEGSKCQHHWSMWWEYMPGRWSRCCRRCVSWQQKFTSRRIVVRTAKPAPENNTVHMRPRNHPRDWVMEKF